MRRARIAASLALAVGAGAWLGAAHSSHTKPSNARMQPAAAVSAVTTLPLPPPQTPLVITGPDGTTVIDAGAGRIAVQSWGPSGQSQYQSQSGPGAQKQVLPGQSQSQRQSGNGSQSQSQSR